MADPEFKNRNVSKKILIAAGIILLFVLGAGLGFWLGNGYSDFTGATVGNSSPAGENTGLITSSAEEGNVVASSVPLVVKVDVNSVPVLSGASTAKEVAVSSNNLNAFITYGSEQLKITPLENAQLKLEGFSGNLNFNQQTVALSGKVSKLEINGVILSMPDLEITLEDSGYDSFQLQDFSSAGFTIINGKGTLLVDNTKNSYAIDFKDTLQISSFVGAVSADKTAEVSFSAEGTVKQVRATGSIDLTLK